MKPAKLVGMPYRLGADPEKNGAVDCLHLAKTYENIAFLTIWSPSGGLF